jgi:hypothetical protein
LVGHPGGCGARLSPPLLGNWFAASSRRDRGASESARVGLKQVGSPSGSKPGWARRLWAELRALVVVPRPANEARRCYYACPAMALQATGGDDELWRSFDVSSQFTPPPRRALGLDHVPHDPALRRASISLRQARNGNWCGSLTWHLFERESRASLRTEENAHRACIASTRGSPQRNQGQVSPMVIFPTQLHSNFRDLYQYAEHRCTHFW